MFEPQYMDLLCALVACRPISGDIKAVNAAQDVLKDFLDRNNIYNTVEIINDRKVVFAATRPVKSVDYLFNAHIDVVPAASDEQYTVVQEGSRLYGRGVGDDLGNAVLLVQLLCECNTPDISAGVIFTADEEIGGKTTAAMVERGYRAEKCALVMDSWGGGHLGVAQKGILSLKLTARGSSGHSSVPWSKDNCIEKLFAGYLKLKEQWIQPTNEEPWGDSLAACQVNAGFAHNQIPDHADMVINIRYINAGDRQAIIDKVRDVTNLEVEVYEGCLPMVSDSSAFELQRLVKLISKYRNLDESVRRLNGATDARHLINMNVPVGITGLATNGAHGARESLNMESIAPTLAMLKEFIGAK